MANRDLDRLYKYVRDETGSPLTAIQYIRRISTQCERLAEYPERGTARPRLGRGVRSMGFERRATILFRVIGERVEIMRIHARGRNVPL